MEAYLHPLVSVVTPVYNGERFLAECIESVLAQTYKNWEYIIVNNCSTDRTLEIATDYCHRDSRIRVYNNQRHLPIIANFNNAVSQISPESRYCKEVHADDLLFPECISKMVELAERNPTVGIVGSYALANNNVEFDGLPFSRSIIPGREVCRATLLGGPYLFGTPSTVLIRSHHIREREKFYDESVLNADPEVCFHILQKADFGFIHQILSLRRIHDSQNDTFAVRNHSRSYSNLFIIKKYGPINLSEKEYKQCFKNYMTFYYTVLGENVFESRGREFWRYQIAELDKLGISFSPSRLGFYVLKHLIDYIGNPKTTLGKIRRAFFSKEEKKTSFYELQNH